MIDHNRVREAANDARAAARTLKGAANQIAEALEEDTGVAAIEVLADARHDLELLERDAKAVAEKLYKLAGQLKADA